MVFYRATYHHGDARAALAEAAFNLARRGGPRMVTLRAAARDVGITAAAVYRHFTTVEELLTVVKCRALRMLAQELDDAVAVTAGRRRAHAVAAAYLSFARECPGLFAMACHAGVDAARDLVAERVGGRRPVGLAVWSAAHGVAALSGSEHEQRQVLDLLLAGVTGECVTGRGGDVPADGSGFGVS